MEKTLKFVSITILCFAAYYLLQQFAFRELYQFLTSILKVKTLCYLLTYLVLGLPILAGVLLLHPPHFLPDALGIRGGIATGAVFALLCTLPMLAGYALVFEFDKSVTWPKIFTGAICAALFEELYFRGFLFGQIYRFTRIGFVPAILIGALVFASGHLYQSVDPGTMIGIFVTTFLGAGLFAWVYAEWKFNLWAPVFLHLFMNLFWMLFSAGDNALGGLYANIFRVLTISLIIIGTIRYKKKKGWAPEVNRKTFWMKRAADVRISA